MAFDLLGILRQRLGGMPAGPLPLGWEGAGGGTPVGPDPSALGGKPNLIDMLSGLDPQAVGGLFDPGQVTQARQAGLLNAGLSLLASGGRLPAYQRPNLGQALQGALQAGQGGYAGVLQAAQALQGQRAEQSLAQAKQQLFAKYAPAIQAGGPEAQKALAALSLEAASLGVKDVGGWASQFSQQFAPKEAVLPQWQKEGYATFEDWRTDKNASDRPEWAKQGYASFEAWQQDKRRVAVAAGGAADRAARGQALTDWRSAISGDNDMARVLSNTEGALAQITSNPDNETAKTALARGVAAMFNKGALSDADVAAFALDPGIAGDVQKVENWFKGKRLTAQQVQNFRGLLQSVRKQNRDRVASMRADQARTWEIDPGYLRNPYDTGEARAALDDL